MTLKESGEFVVSIFDKNDPDHIRKKQWYQRNNMSSKNEAVSTKINTSDNNNNNDDMEHHQAYTYEQIVLMISCAVVFVLYIVAKMTFPTSLSVIE